MSRSKWKSPFLNISLALNNLRMNKTSSIAKIWSRASVIPQFLVGKYVFVYNGKIFKKVYITREKVGYKFGSFSLTRKYTYKIRKAKKKTL